MESYSLNKEITMPDVLAYGTPIRPIKPADRKPAPAECPTDAPPAQATFFAEWRKILAGRLAR